MARSILKSKRREYHEEDHQIRGLCCANCAAKIEEGVKKLDGVNSASLSFMTQRLIMEVEDGREDELVEAARAVAAKVEPEAEFKVLR